MRGVKIFIVMIFCFITIGVAPIAAFAQSDDEKAVLSLKYNVFEDGVVEVMLDVSSSDGVCGLLATLEYDASALALMSCGVGEKNEGILNFTCREQRGRVAFLLDGKQNSEPRGTLASFYFRIIDENAQSATVELLTIEKGCAYTVTNGEIREAFPDVTRAKLSIRLLSERESDADFAANHIAAVSFMKTDGALTLNIIGNVLDDKCFAVGYKIFCVNTETAETATVIAARMTSGERAELDVAVPRFERACVIITPLSYNGKSITEGEKRVMLVE